MVAPAKLDEAFCISSKIHYIPLARANLNANIKLKITLSDNAWKSHLTSLQWSQVIHEPIEKELLSTTQLNRLSVIYAARANGIIDN
jgi:hypothetical protein